MEVKLDLEGIARCFGPGRSVEDTLKLLDVEDAAWAVSAAKRIRRGSPLSLRLTQAMLEAGARTASLQDCLTMEYRMVCRVVKEPDFKEGVRDGMGDFEVTHTRDARETLPAGGRPPPVP